VPIFISMHLPLPLADQYPARRELQLKGAHSLLSNISKWPPPPG
jgi:hypothetical protein